MGPRGQHRARHSGAGRPPRLPGLLGTSHTQTFREGTFYLHLQLRPQKRLRKASSFLKVRLAQLRCLRVEDLRCAHALQLSHATLISLLLSGLVDGLMDGCSSSEEVLRYS